MTATVTVEEGNGSTPTWTTVTTIRFCSSDTYDPQLNYPILIPTSGSNYSYWKNVRLAWTGDYTQITNIKVYPADTTLDWTGCTLWIGCTEGTFNADNVGLTDAQYVQATGTQGTTGDEMVANHTNVASRDSLFSYSSSSPLTVDTTQYGTGGGHSKHIVLQLEVSSTATSGVKTGETLTFQWDEI